MTELAFRRHFPGGRVPPWLERFEVEPVAAIEDLLLGQADLGHLNASEPIQVLLDWLERLSGSGFAAAVDAALAEWIELRWADPSLLGAGGVSALAAEAWCRAADLIGFDPRLRQAAKALLCRAPKERAFLSSLGEGRSRDPAGRAWLALARHQEDRGLLLEWWRMTNLTPDTPWYHGGYGIAGLRGLPPEDRRLAGTFPQEVAQGLARLARALASRADEGWLDETVAREEFLRTARLTISAYPFKDRWVQFWRHALALPGAEPSEAHAWMRSLYPDELRREAKAELSRQKRWVEPNPSWSRRVERIAAGLEKEDWELIPEAEALLAEQARFAEQTGNSYFIVRSACNFAAKVLRSKPALALAWVDGARRLEPWDAFAWTTSSSCLVALGRLREALEMALEAVRRFPENGVARTGLGEVLRQADRLEEAEKVYRETIELFPQDAYARSGLGEVLRQGNRLEEAEKVYRETAELFPQNAYARTGLGEVLRQGGQLEEAEKVYRETVRRFPQNAHARSGLGEALRQGGQLQEAEEVYRAAVELFAADVVARNGLGEVLRQGHRLEEAENLYRATVELFPHDVVARTGLGEVLRQGGQLEEAEKVYREAVELFPQNAYARSGLGSVLRQSGRMLEADEVHEPRAFYEATFSTDRKQDGTAPFSGSVWPAARGPADAEVRRLRSEDIEILLQDSYLLRRWGMRSGSVMAGGTGMLREKARKVLQRLSVAQAYNAKAAGELGLLEVESGDLRQALDLMRAASLRFPGSARVRYALARAEREAVSGQDLNPARIEAPAIPWRRLARIDERLLPVRLLGEGRTWLGQVDGKAIEHNVRECFGGLGQWIASHLAATHRTESSDFIKWWAREVGGHLFAGSSVTHYDHVPAVPVLRERLDQLAIPLNDLEETWVGRWAET